MLQRYYTFTTIQVLLRPYGTAVGVTNHYPPISLIDTVPATSNSLSTSAASSSSKLSMFIPLPAETCPVVETSTTISNPIPSAAQPAKQTSKKSYEKTS
ncbi:hypothetical protein TNCV_3485091 [Trichonephila clavipes]|nr:hypothetical protein TNCV_3485091 [Trichonephila clavipes]